MTAEVYEAYSKAVEAWDRVPKASFSTKMEDGVATYSCPKCGVCFAQVDYNYYTSLRFNEPIICCGNLLR